MVNRANWSWGLARARNTKRQFAGASRSIWFQKARTSVTLATNCQSSTMNVAGSRSRSFSSLIRYAVTVARPVADAAPICCSIEFVRLPNPSCRALTASMR